MTDAAFKHNSLPSPIFRIAEMVETPSTASTKAKKLLKQLGP